MSTLNIQGRQPTQLQPPISHPAIQTPLPSYVLFIVDQQGLYSSGTRSNLQPERDYSWHVSDGAVAFMPALGSPLPRWSLCLCSLATTRSRNTHQYGTLDSIWKARRQ